MTAPKTTLDWEIHNHTLTACRDCERLVAWREQVAREKRRAYLDWDYWGKPIPGFGDTRARLLVVGLAPGAHGSNRTGRMFTGDASGEFLYTTLHREGFANQPASTHRNDGLRLKNVFITAVCRCAPPGNKPAPQEIKNCRKYLLAEIALLNQVQGIVALGKIAFDEVLDIFLPAGESKSAFPFFHGAFFSLPAGLPWLLASYHPSRQNTQTGRLTATMFDAIWQAAARKL
ncbi:MAG TPA: uracil-DNA glycosylase [Anaerolineaceae bacterium]|nr:uracil-DNA glycosylase [Anaerolineaceae bacterium]